jgi:conjugative relaxase-like TrwC/TraI family protein
MVCSIAAGRAAGYYISEQSRYYTGGKEPLGRWFSPSGELGLTDGAEIDDELFTRLHGGQDSGGRFLARFASGTRHNRVPAYDLTFSAPKSVSIVWALSNEVIRQNIEQAHEQAIRAALIVLEDEAAFARRGKGGVSLESVRLAGAIFQHGEARPTENSLGELESDPQLHSHAVIFNLARRNDESYGAIDGRHLFKWKMAAGAIYRAELATRLNELGYAIERSDDKGLFEIAGIPRATLEAFSRRRQEICAALAEKGLATSEAPNLAAAVTKASRKSKIDNGPASERHEAWQKRADEIGLTQNYLAQLRNENRIIEATDFRHDVESLSRLTEHEAVFHRQHIFAEIAAQGVGRGFRAEQIKQAAHELLSHDELVELGKDKLGFTAYSTKEMIATENELVHLAIKLANRSFSPASHALVKQLATESGLNAEQSEAAYKMAGSEALIVFQGGAGTGKTSTLLPVVKAYAAKGYKVIGAATAWRAARQLGNECQVEAKAIDKWLAEAKAGKAPINSQTAMVIDEAGLLSSRQMCDLLAMVDQAGAKAILCGDEKQLQAVGAGPGLRLVSQHAKSIGLDTNRRQKEAWAREMVSNFAKGHSDKAIAALDLHGCLHWAKDKEAAYQSAIKQWRQQQEANPEQSSVVLAVANHDVRKLNLAIRDNLKQRGKISAAEFSIQVADRSGKLNWLSLSVGDQVEFLRRNDQLSVINGDNGKIIAISQESPGHLRLRLAMQGRKIEFSTRDITDSKDRIKLAHAYARTIHNAQGLTADNAVILASQSMTRNQIYVAASRARNKTTIIIDQSAIDQQIRRKAQNHGRDLGHEPDKQERLAALANAWSREEEKASVLSLLSLPENVVQSVKISKGTERIAEREKYL